MDSNLPWSEQYRLAGEDWAEKEAAASLLEDTKSAVMAQRQAELLAMDAKMAVNRSEQIVKASPEWTQYVEETVGARKAANLAKVKMEFMKMRFQEHQSHEATARAESRLV